MSDHEISKEIQNFIFDYIDSVEHLEILKLIFENPDRVWTNETLSSELRSSQESIKSRIKSLLAHGVIVHHNQNSHQYLINNEQQHLKELLTMLLQLYKSRRFRVLDLIFSPMKKARGISNAFNFFNSSKGEGENNNG